MHISPGVIDSIPVLVGGGALTAAGVAVGLRRMDYDRVPQVAVLSATFYVASLIHVPVGPANVHLLLNGLVGIVLGWAAFPALLVALFLQAVFFGFGGLENLGVNTVTMALPAVVCYYLFNGPARKWSIHAAGVAGFLAGAVSVMLSCVLLAAALIATDKAFATPLFTLVAAHIPIVLVEGIITAGAVVFLRRVRPELLWTGRAEVG